MAQTVEQFYTDRQVTLIVGNAAGSGYDVIGRMVARYMGKHLPGKPTFVVRNMPGAGGITATNHMNTVADRDGSTIAVVGREAILDPLFSGDASKAVYDSRKFVWLGTPNQEIGMAYAMTKSGVKTIQDVMQREVTSAAAGATSGSAVTPRLLNALIGTKFKIIMGYPGSMEAMRAMESGEADARVTSGWAGPETTAAMEWVKEGKAVLLLQIGVSKHPDYPTVPLVMDLAKSDADRKVMELIFVAQQLGRPFFGPPGIPADRATALQTAFARTMEDPDFRKEAEAQKIDLSPLLAKDMQAIVDRVYGAPKDLIQRAVEVTALAKK
jgi:tripartite-type tricarboxylate transporter receptor subunit TctC